MFCEQLIFIRCVIILPLNITLIQLTYSAVLDITLLTYLIENWEPIRCWSHCSASFWFTLILTAWCDTTVADLLLSSVVSSPCLIGGWSDSSMAVFSESTLEPVDTGIYNATKKWKPLDCVNHVIFINILTLTHHCHMFTNRTISYTILFSSFYDTSKRDKELHTATQTFRYESRTKTCKHEIFLVRSLFNYVFCKVKHWPDYF